MSEQAPAVTGFAAPAVDCADPPALADFWHRVLGGRIEVDEDLDASVLPPDGPRLDVLRVPEPKTVKDRLHIDLRTDDLDAAREQVLAPGAHPGRRRPRRRRLVRAARPEGNEFCLLGGPTG